MIKAELSIKDDSMYCNNYRIEMTYYLTWRVILSDGTSVYECHFLEGAIKYCLENQ